MSFRVSFAIPKNSIYKARFDKVILQMIEGGLTKKFFNEEMDKAAKKARSTVSKAIANPLSLHHLQAPLFLLPLLILGCILAFCVEIFVGYNK
jgi:hypothetical protein